MLFFGSLFKEKAEANIMGNFVEVQLAYHIIGDFLMTNTAEATVKMVDEEEEEHHLPQEWVARGKEHGSQRHRIASTRRGYI